MTIPIDWSKAPEGATQYGLAGTGKLPVWLNDLGYAYASAAQGPMYYFGGSEAYGAYSREDIEVLFDRPPQAWNGEGLPPVGTAIEWTDCENLKLEVVGHYKGAVVAVDPNDPRNIYTGKSQRYRPIRTPEQIAADERESAVKKMMNRFAIYDIPNVPWHNLFGQMYDAGYRKP
jgi:hypothetical protein